MPPTRRVKVLAMALAVILCIMLYLSKDSSSEEFYTRTVTALDRNEASDRNVAHQLRNAKDTTKEQEPIAASPQQKPIAFDSNPSNAAVPTYTDVNEEKSVAGRKTMKGGEISDSASGKTAATESTVAVDEKGLQVGDEPGGKETTVEREEDHAIETELNSILKKGPIIIFSKSYCPYSAKAKKILLDKYTIIPAPHVVELDTHPMGQGLQIALGKSTGRRTVPNVLINGRSIGGGDDIEALDDSGGLIEKVKGMAGKRIMEARLADGT